MANICTNIIAPQSGWHKAAVRVCMGAHTLLAEQSVDHNQHRETMFDKRVHTRALARWGGPKSQRVNNQCEPSASQEPACAPLLNFNVHSAISVFNLNCKYVAWRII